MQKRSVNERQGAATKRPAEPVISILTFGRALIESQDLDPVYVGVNGMHLTDDEMKRWLMAYWMFYHAGFACWMMHSKPFWLHMRDAAENLKPLPFFMEGRWPRGTERRHFLGGKAVQAIEHLSRKAPEEWINSLLGLRKHTSIIKEVKKNWPMCGDWIGYKIADMLERCLGHPVEFGPANIYKEPAAALIMLKGQITYEQLLEHFSEYPAPPLGAKRTRGCSHQEIETILCKWKSHRGGHYEVGKDTREVRHALKGWGETADRMLRFMP